MMVAYGPVEDPQIAIGIVIEYGGGGARAGNLVADIFDAYSALQNGTLTLPQSEAESGDPAAQPQAPAASAPAAAPAQEMELEVDASPEGSVPQPEDTAQEDASSPQIEG